MAINRAGQLAVCTFGVLLVSGVAAAAESPYVLSTHGGLTVKARDGSSQARISGRLMWDTDVYDGVYNQSAQGRSGGESEARRARFGFAGFVHPDWAFDLRINVNDVRGQATINTGVIKYSGWSFARLSSGRFKRPFGLEQATSSKWTTTVERSMIWDLVPAVNIADFGGMLVGQIGEIHWAVGLFDDGAENSVTGADHLSVSGRLHSSRKLAGGGLIHGGLGYGQSALGGDVLVDVSSRLAVHTARRLGLVNAFLADEDSQYGVELAWRQGPVSVQAEYINRLLEDPGARELTIRGGYLQAAWTVTGEPRKYSSSSGSFSALQLESGRTAVELVAKWDSAEIGGEGRDIDLSVLTVGGTLWFNPQVRLMLNVLSAKVRGLPGPMRQDDGGAVSTRLQYVF